MDIQQIKQRFGIIGNSGGMNRAIDIAVQVAATDLSVLISGESGTGKEFFPQIIHNLSSRKHESYIAVNCGAIPEGTIDSELFGHEKGAFTGAVDSRKGYFEVADKGTIFLDEIAELPLSTQVRLLRVLETGEFIRVGSSKVIKTDVRVVAATNVNLMEAVRQNKFREDLFYRLNTVPIIVPPLRNRKGDIALLFRKFASDFSEKYTMPAIRLTEDATVLLENYWWRGNIRQLKNVTEQISIIEEQRIITAEILSKYLPDESSKRLPAIYNETIGKEEFSSEREILYKILFDMRSEINELKSFVRNLGSSGERGFRISDNSESAFLSDYEKKYQEKNNIENENYQIENIKFSEKQKNIEDTEEIIEESLSLKDKEIELIKKALEKHNGKRKYAAEDLGISERTLYRKIKDYDLEN
jgi:transcriptional regulator with PAS, ATPase and Fis domain